MMAWSKLRRASRPRPSSTAIWLGPVNLPAPCTTLTLRCLASRARPPVSLADHVVSFQPRSLSRSICGLPKRRPWAAISSASVITLAACSSALDGMQPTLRQTPPSVGDSARSARLACPGRRRGRRRCSRRGRRRAPRTSACRSRRRHGGAGRWPRLGAGFGALPRWRPSGAAAAAASPRVRRSSDQQISVPSETLSPTLTFSFSTTPACGRGDVHGGLVGFHGDQGGVLGDACRPGLTRTSMISTSLKSPMSGTLISMDWLMVRSRVRAIEL